MYGPTKTRTMALGIQFAHGQILDKPSFDLFQVKMVAVEKLLARSKSRLSSARSFQGSSAKLST